LTGKSPGGTVKLTILPLAFVLLAVAQSGQDAPATEPNTVYSQVPFDLSATQLPPHFTGHDIVALYNAFQKVSSLKRDDYETTGQFEQRAGALRLKPLVGDIGPKSTLAIVIPVSATVPPPYDEGAFSSYDADKRLLTFGLQCSTYHLSSLAAPSPKLRKSAGYSIAVKDDSTITDGIKGTNVFGATVETSHIHVEKYEILWDNGEEFRARQSRGVALQPYRIRPAVIQAEPEVARRIRDSLRALIVCSAKDELPTFLETTGYSATFDHPTSSLSYKHFLNVTLLAVWFFDANSGNVYGRVQPKK
jgi:hypothetical protein